MMAVILRTYIFFSMLDLSFYLKYWLFLKNIGHFILQVIKWSLEILQVTDIKTVYSLKRDYNLIQCYEYCGFINVRWAFNFVDFVVGPNHEIKCPRITEYQIFFLLKFKIH